MGNHVDITVPALQCHDAFIRDMEDQDVAVRQALQKRSGALHHNQSTIQCMFISSTAVTHHVTWTMPKIVAAKDRCHHKSSDQSPT